MRVSVDLRRVSRGCVFIAYRILSDAIGGRRGVAVYVAAKIDSAVHVTGVDAQTSGAC